MCTYLDKNTNANNKQKKEENSVYILTESHSYKDIISDTHTHTLFKTFPPTLPDKYKQIPSVDTNDILP